MCNWISYVEINNTIMFLTDDIVKKRLNEFKEFNKNWEEDIKGHGAIRWFYDNDFKGGISKEYEDFTSPSNFPKEIVEAIKDCKFKLISFNVHLLNDKAKKEHKEIEQKAWEEYHKIERQACEEYNKTSQQAWEEYLKIERQAYEKYYKIIQQAYKEYYKISQSTFWNLFKDVNNRREEWR